MLRPVLAVCASMFAATFGAGALSGAPLSASDSPSPATMSAARATDGLGTTAQPNKAALNRVPRATQAVAAVAGPPVRLPGAKSLIVAPQGCAALGRSFDIVFHFHGAYTTMEPQLLKSGINAVFVIENLGNGSGPYDARFAGGGSFNAALESVRARINKTCGGEQRSVGRVALSGWSAGYGSVFRILSRPSDAARVDAVLLADGMHTGYEPSNRRQVLHAGMAPFMGFAEAAARGEKLMAVTHSAIIPPGYASTTETARYIVDGLNLAPAAERAPEPRPGMQQTSNDERGNLHVIGYAGGDARAHCDHLHGISATLWSRLRDRWQTR